MIKKKKTIMIIKKKLPVINAKKPTTVATNKLVTTTSASYVKIGAKIVPRKPTKYFKVSGVTITILFYFILE